MPDRPRHLILDMDGTLYLGPNVFAGTRELLEVAAARDLGISYMTNNCSRSRSDYERHIAALGLDVGRWEVVTSGDATIDHLLANGLASGPVHLLGTPSLAAQFAESGLRLARDGDEPAVVVVAFDTGLTFDRLCQTAWWLSQGKPFIATHPDVYCPTHLPTVLVDCGSICRALTAATGVEPTVIGKPNPAIVEGILRRHDLAPAEVMVVGDRLETDIAVGQNAGCTTALVLTGATSREQAAAADPPPSHLFEHVGELAAWIARG